MLDADGTVRLAINVIEDITELKRAEQAQRFLAEASRVLADSLDYEETLRHGRPAGGAGDRRLVRGRPRRRRPLEARVAVEHVDPARVELARELQERYPPDPRTDHGRLRGAAPRRSPSCIRRSPTS